MVTGIFPPDIGGPATYVPKVAQFLAEHAHSVEVITLSDHPSSAADEELPFTIIRIPRAAPLPLRAWLTCRAILRAARRADCIYVNGLYTHAAVVMRLLGRKYLVKVVGDPAWERSVGRGVFSGDIESFQRAPLNFSGRLFRWMRNVAIQRAHTVIVPSEYLKRLVIGWGVPPEKILVVRNGTSLSPSAAPPTPPTPPFALVTVARLVPWKGVSEIVQCVAQLPDCHLTIIGDGPLRDTIQEQIETLGVRARVHLLGRKNRSEVLEVLGQSHLFILNSSYEGLPHIVLEAAAAGVPALVKDRGGSSEAIVSGQTGFLYSDLTPQVIREALETIQAGTFRTLFRPSTEKLIASFDEGLMLQRTAEVLVR